MKLFKNKVGRPSNETLKKRKIFYLIVVLLSVFLIAGVAVLFHFVSTNKLIGAATQSLIGNTNEHKFTKVFSYDTSEQKANKKTDSDDLANALQGSTGYNGVIYYAAHLSGRKNLNFYKEIKTYSLNSQKISNVSDLEEILDKYPSYKVNDATTDTNKGINYYLAYDGSGKDDAAKTGKIFFRTNNIIRELELSKSFSNIAYNSTNKSFYSVKGSKLYKFEIPDVSKNNTSTKLGIVNIPAAACDFYRKDDITTQGITMSGYRLYFVYMLPDDINNVTKYTNYLSIYDTRQCKTGIKLKPVHTVNLGVWIKGKEIENAEPESMFFMNSKLYIGYNSSKVNNISFYRLDLPNKKLSASIKVKSVNGNKVTLQATAKSKDIKLYAYKFCTNEKGTDCAYDAFKDSNNTVKTPNNVTVTYAIDNNNSDWYFFVTDVLGNRKTVKISKNDIQRAVCKANNNCPTTTKKTTTKAAPTTKKVVTTTKAATTKKATTKKVTTTTTTTTTSKVTTTKKVTTTNVCDGFAKATTSTIKNYVSASANLSNLSANNKTIAAAGTSGSTKASFTFKARKNGITIQNNISGAFCGTNDACETVSNHSSYNVTGNNTTRIKNVWCDSRYNCKSDWEYVTACAKVTCGNVTKTVCFRRKISNTSGTGNFSSVK